MSIPAPTPGPAMVKRALHKRAVVTVTSVADSTPTASNSTPASTHIPIGPVVGGIVAGVAAVLIVGGIWYWCHRKSQREKAEAKERALARANRKAGGGKPTLIKNKSTTSEQSTGSSHFAEKSGVNRSNAPPVPAVPSQYLVNKHGQSVRSYGQERGYDQYHHSGDSRQVVDASAGPQYIEHQDKGEYYSNQSGTELNTHGRSPTSPTGSTGSSIPSPKSTTSSSSGSDRRSRAQQRIEAANAAKEREAALAAANPIVRYQPARPSPLRAQEKQQDDEEGVPKWGSKPFRTAHSSSTEQGPYQPPQQPAPVSLAPPVEQSGRDKAVSGEWGVAYSDVDDGAGAFEHDDYDTRSDGRKSMGAETSLSSSGRQATGRAYDLSPRSRAVSGGAPPMPDQYSQQQYYGGASAYDPYAQDQRGYRNDQDPYAPSPVRQDLQQGGY